MRAFAPFISEIRPSGGGLPTVAFHERRLRDVFSPGAPHLFGPIETPSWVSWLRQALLDLNRDDLAWRIQANPASAVDLTAKWKFDDSHWSDELRKSGMMPGLRVHLRLHEDVHLVRSLDEDFEVNVQAGLTHLSLEASYGTGQLARESFEGTFGRRADGTFGRISSIRFSTEDIKEPLRQVVVRHGWAWRGMMIGGL
jgi:hypothetical protein